MPKNQKIIIQKLIKALALVKRSHAFLKKTELCKENQRLNKQLEDSELQLRKVKNENEVLKQNISALTDVRR